MGRGRVQGRAVEARSVARVVEDVGEVLDGRAGDVLPGDDRDQRRRGWIVPPHRAVHGNDLDRGVPHDGVRLEEVRGATRTPRVEDRNREDATALPGYDVAVCVHGAPLG